ncbi:MAG: hypothetical protein H5T85_00435 [Actinobacteria bacterium]|nr:hypothetical protein [Actinomycetota bacterium]
MSKKTIILLIVTTAVLIVASVTTVYGETQIEDAFLKDSSTPASLEQGSIEDIPSFNSTSSVFLTILVKNISTDDVINIKWKKIENGEENTIQDNTLNVTEKGSGKIVISLARKNKKLEVGDYIVEIYLNGKREMVKEFRIK